MKVVVTSFELWPMNPSEFPLASPVPISQPAYDVFNGDADGLCALHQLRLAEPRAAILVTGAKRDIALLERVPPQQAREVCALDISLDANVAAVHALVDAGCRVQYFDHHAAQQAFVHPLLQLHWDESPEACTSILVDRYLQGRFRAWAIVAAFGDNLEGVARAMATDFGLTTAQADALQLLGTVLNYNAYGESVADLHFAPDALYLALQPYADPFAFIAETSEYRLLVEGYAQDAERMEGLRPIRSSPCGDVYVLPDAAWARRISGIFANQLAAQAAGRSFAVLTGKSDGSFGVSVRSGSPNVLPAHRFCEGYPTGGGRKLAAGVNRLPANQIESFIERFLSYFAEQTDRLSKPEA
jgi:hypothetical protein